MNWPKGIVLVFLLFASGIGFLVYKTTEKKSEMVADNYYEKELKYQQVIDGKLNAQKLSSLPRVTVHEAGLAVRFPDEMEPGLTEGNLYFYRASDRKKDVEVPISLDTAHTQYIPVNRFSNGYYQAQITWRSGETDYYSEQNIYIP